VDAPLVLITVFTIVLVAYLAGSVSTSILISRFHGEDIRLRDLPGTSGMFRQYGALWGLTVLALDIVKGLVAAWLAGFGEGFWVVPLAALAVVAGHIYPVFFGFRGGGGLATSAGFLLYLYPLLTLATLALGLAIAGVYHLVSWGRRRQGIYPLPFASPFAYLFLLVALRDDPKGLWTVALMSLVISWRGLQLLRRPRPLKPQRPG
jgi:acyl-phosphate glycerol 3-phosphate acyltransferase